MKIKSFNPLILTSDTESTIKLFEDLGFEKCHTRDDYEEREDIVGVHMKDANSFCVDVVKSDRAPKDMVMNGMNVDDFDEARNMLEKHGLNSPSEAVEDASSKSIGMYSPSGLSIGLVEYKRLILTCFYGVLGL